MFNLRNFGVSKKTIWQIIFASFCILNFLTVKVFAKKCDVCKDIIKRFNEGLEKTKKFNFGGGNTNWETKTLGTYKTSETRLVEIIEHYLCQENKELEEEYRKQQSQFKAPELPFRTQCHMMLEENEELLEKYYFTVFAKHQSTEDMYEWLCIENIKACCPINTYGPKCTSCTGGSDRPCMGNGECDGSGTREGSGKCTCERAYNGENCESCQLGYYEEYRNTTHVICEKCHKACRTCEAAGPKGCRNCIEGWTKSKDGETCIDVDECSREKPECGHNKYCVNTEGSFRCVDCDDGCDTCTGPGPDKCIECRVDHYRDGEICRICDKACWGCTGTGSGDCENCAPGYELQGKNCTDVDECETQKDTVCPGGNVDCINTLGSYTCQCHDGYVMEDKQCVVKPKDEEEEDESNDKELEDLKNLVEEAAGKTGEKMKVTAIKPPAASKSTSGDKKVEEPTSKTTSDDKKDEL